MVTKMQYRFYSFVANHYLSPLQCGLQTAHAVARMSVEPFVTTQQQFKQWAEVDQVIIICGAGNQAGVVNCYETMLALNAAAPYSDQLPVVLFREDQQSMNCMATACGILVPSSLYDAVDDPTVGWCNGNTVLSYNQAAMAAFLKSYRLA